MTANERRARQLADIRIRLEKIYDECDDLYTEMGRDNKMGRLWSRNVTDPVGTVIAFINTIQTRAKVLIAADNKRIERDAMDSEGNFPDANLDEFCKDRR